MIRRWLACRKLQRMVESNRNSFAVQDYRKRREAALKHTRAMPFRLVIIESPYAGDIEANVAYARAAMRDSLRRCEAPIASHLLYTQPGILRDEVPDERQLGIDAGLAWRTVAERVAFYVDRGWSSGMIAARETYEREGKPFEIRTITQAGEADAPNPSPEAGEP